MLINVPICLRNLSQICDSSRNALVECWAIAYLSGRDYAGAGFSDSGALPVRLETA